VHVAFSSVVILFACVPLCDSIRRSGIRRFWAFLVLAPLVLFSFIQLAHAAISVVFVSDESLRYMSNFRVYFWPERLAVTVGDFWGSLNLTSWEIVGSIVEATKWCIIFVIAIWLSVAQLAAWFRGNKRSTA
jgi:hypothetical protein